MLPPLFPWLMQEYSLSFTQAGALMTVFYVVSGIGQVFAGFLVDRWGSHRVICLGIAMLALSGVFVGVSVGLWSLYAAAFIAGLGNSVFHPADFALLNHRVSQARLGHGFSVHGLSGNAGWAIGPLFMTAAASSFGWRTAGFLAAGVGAASLGMLWWNRSELSSQAKRSTESDNVALRSLLSLRLTWLAFTFFLLSTLVFGALQNFAPALLGSLYGLSLAAATSSLTAYLVGGIIGLSIGGFLAGATTGQEKTVVLCFLSAAGLSLILGSAVAPSWAVIGIMAAMGFGVGIVGPSRDMLIRQATAARVGTRAFGRMYGLVYSGLDAGLATAPLLFGMLMDAGHTQLVFAGVSLSLVLAAIAARWIGLENRHS